MVTQNNVAILVFNFIVFLASKTYGCGAERPSKLADKVAQSDVVVYGRVHGHSPQPNVGPEAYTAHMDVVCFLKGGPMATRIDITDAGFIPPGCLQTNLEIGREYIVTLEQLRDGTLHPLDPEIPFSNATFDRMTAFCQLDIRPPTDVTASESERCPKALDADSCGGNGPKKAKFKPTKPKVITTIEIKTQKHTEPIVYSTIDPSNAMLNKGSLHSRYTFSSAMCLAIIAGHIFMRAFISRS